ncbi:MAG: hypothetical protein M3N13_03400 [Candidatus Eremiobacteraeota bacterium]|nr:hypothetical protein [Candidatus Eremiobacteraeota bacterium]
MRHVVQGVRRVIRHVIESVDTYGKFHTGIREHGRRQRLQYQMFARLLEFDHDDDCNSEVFPVK